MDLRYPIGTFAHVGQASPQQRESWIRDIEQLPLRLREAVEGLTDQQMELPYREGGWSVRQVVHHVADSHMNSFIRFKLALTEDNPTIKPYNEHIWASLQDTSQADVSLSFSLLEGLHRRWAVLLRSMHDADYRKTFYHPESKKTIPLDYNLGLYAWHGKHHTAHITTLRARLTI